MKVAQSCLTLCDPMDYTVHGILQARILEWVAFHISRRSCQPRDRAQVSLIAGGFFTSWTTGEGHFSSVQFSRSVVSDSLRLWGLISPWNSSGQNTGVGSLPFPSPGIFTTQGSNPGLPHCTQILYELSHQGSPIYVCMCIYIDIHTHDFEVNYWWEILIYPNF